MFMNNHVTIVGNLTRDVELRYTTKGTAVANVGIAWNIKRGDEKIPQFLDLTIWGELAENVAASLGKGSRVIAAGELRHDTWEKDGKKGSKHILNVDAIGPEMRWAEVKVIPVDSNNQPQQSSATSAPTPAPTPAPQPAQTAAFDPDEEPF
jgi:single-strand DNA-binding protein